MGQCWSVVEYLAGSQASPDRLGRFRSFLSELKATGSQEAVFARHFGNGFDVLLQEWRSWVQQQGLGTDSIPPPEIRTAIVEKLLPVIRDRSKKAEDRIQAMRAMGGAGYVFGADALDRRAPGRRRSAQTNGRLGARVDLRPELGKRPGSLG